MTRSYRHTMACLVALIVAGCSRYGPESTVDPADLADVNTRVPASVASPVSGASVAAETAQLRAAFPRETPRPTAAIMPDDPAWVERAAAEIARSGLTIDHPQLIVVVDRAPAVQAMAIILARSDAPWQVIGGSRVSTGQASRRGYFITPTGVFTHATDGLDYRALGTFNENHIRGLGLKGMRVWDFGWRKAEKGWTRDGQTADIRLLMHATDPVSLEPRLGRPASKGCVRIPAAMNLFLDLHGVLDADQERAAESDPRVRAVLRPDRNPTSLAGNLLVVVDSSVITSPRTE